MKNILISGGTGFIGKHLIEYLRAIDEELKLTVLVRSKEGLVPKKNVDYVLWDVEKKEISEDISPEIDTIFHLAGANIAEERWTTKRKDILLKSRTESGKLLVNWVQQHGKQVKTFISASGVGYYGEGKPDQVFTEENTAGNDFLSELCVRWEGTTAPLAKLGIRLVWIRTGLVLDPSGGMWKELQKAFTFRVAPQFGSGQQIFSWIALQDIVKLYVFAAQNEVVDGPVNAVSPHPLPQVAVAKALLKKESSCCLVLPIPETLLTLGMGELSTELLKSAEVSADKALAEGYLFAQPKIEDL